MAGCIRTSVMTSLSGATPRQVLPALTAETRCVVTLGAALGLAAGAPAVRHGPRPSPGAGPACGVAAGLALAHGCGDRLPAARHGGHGPPGPRRSAAYEADVSNRPQGSQEAAALL